MTADRLRVIADRDARDRGYIAALQATPRQAPTQQELVEYGPLPDIADARLGQAEQDRGELLALLRELREHSICSSRGICSEGCPYLCLWELP